MNNCARRASAAHPAAAAPGFDLEALTMPYGGEDVVVDVDQRARASADIISSNSRKRIADEAGESVYGVVRSAQHLGYATSSLLLISTLTFGFAIAAIVELTSGRKQAPLLTDSIVLVFLSGAASLSVLTTAFGLLEYYYIEMVAGADERCRYIDADTADRFEGEFKEILTSFNHQRGRARNAMWGALVLTQLAAAVQLNRAWLTELDLNPAIRTFYITGDILASLLQLGGVVSVLSTVRSVRSVFRPLLSKYRLGYA